MQNTIAPSKIRSFTDLYSWKEAHKLALLIYKSTDNFPLNEKYSLIDQMRRAAVSKRKTSVLLYCQRLVNRITKLTPLEQRYRIYSKELFKEAAEQTVLVDKLISGLIKSIKSHN